MATTLMSVTTDCSNAETLGRFWAQVLDQEIADGANEHFAIIPGSPNWVFLQVPETKTAKNRVHVDLDVADLGAERTRLEGLGATFVHEKHEFGIHWVTFQDPEGNEFCVGEH